MKTKSPTRKKTGAAKKAVRRKAVVRPRMTVAEISAGIRNEQYRPVLTMDYLIETAWLLVLPCEGRTWDWLARGKFVKNRGRRP
jgi:hypothetical protein